MPNLVYSYILYIYIYIYIYMCESKYGLKSDSMKVAEKHTTFILSDFNTYLLSFCPFGKTNTKYNLTRHLTGMIPNDLYIYENLLVIAYFSINGRFCLVSLGNATFSNVSTCQTRSYDFWIMNAMCTSVYLFVLYFSFVPVISASIHRYVTILISKSW